MNMRATIFTYLITLLITIPFHFASAQQSSGKLDIEGQWLGVITQEDGGYATSYEFELFLSRTGNKLGGRSYSRVDDLYTILDLKGEIKSGMLIYLEETKIVDVHLHDGLHACYKSAQLRVSYENGKLKLEGFWRGNTESGACIPGKVILYKEKPRA